MYLLGNHYQMKMKTIHQGVRLRSTSTAYLLWIKETHNLSQKALDDIVQSTLVSATVKSVCVNIANLLQSNAQEEDDVLQTSHGKL